MAHIPCAATVLGWPPLDWTRFWTRWGGVGTFETPRPPAMGGSGPPNGRIRTSEICVKNYGPPYKPQEGPSEESEV